MSTLKRVLSGRAEFCAQPDEHRRVQRALLSRQQSPQRKKTSALRAVLLSARCGAWLEQALRRQRLSPISMRRSRARLSAMRSARCSKPSRPMVRVRFSRCSRPSAMCRPSDCSPFPAPARHWRSIFPIAAPRRSRCWRGSTPSSRDAGGALYPAKDGRISSDMFQRLLPALAGIAKRPADEFRLLAKGGDMSGASEEIVAPQPRRSGLSSSARLRPSRKRPPGSGRRAARELCLPDATKRGSTKSPPI